MKRDMHAPAINSILRNFPLIGWLSYDFAASAYTFAIATLFLPLYYTGYILPFENTTTIWGLMVLSSYAIIAIIGPMLGAYADRLSIQTPIFRSALIIISFLIYALIFVDKLSLIGAIALFILMNVCFGVAAFLYDSHLITATSKKKNITLLSGIAWALGYLGGPLCVWIVFISLGNAFPEKPETYKLAFKIVSIFYLMFSVPVFLLIREPSSQKTKTKPFLKIRQNYKAHKPFLLFLTAMFFISEGAITVIYFASIYSKEVLGFTIYDTASWLGFGQIIGIFSTVGFAILANRTNEIKVLMLCSMIWILALVLITCVTSKILYYGVAFLVGLVIGSIPSISRGYIGKIIPLENRGEAYGMTSTVTRFAALFGPLSYILTSSIFGERYAILAPVPFFIIGILVLVIIQRLGTQSSIL